MKEKPIIEKQPPPFTIKIELTEGCNLYCPFCGIRGIRNGPGDFKFMAIKTAKIIAKKIAEANWIPRIEFTMRGEPLMNPNNLRIFKIIRKHNPKIPMMICTNGGPLLKKPGPSENIDELLDVINVLAIDYYEYAKIVPKIIRNYKGKNKIKHFPPEPLYKKRKPSEHVFIIIKDISKDGKTVRRLNNQCLAAGPPNYKMKNKMCALPFREMVIRWNGMVDLCCQDWRMLYIIGNILKQPIDKIWNSKKMWATRNKLYYRQRDFVPCLGCDKISYRVGLLPDKLGKYDCHKPTAKDEAIIKKVLSIGAQSKVILRPWEKGEIGIKKYMD